MRHFRILDYFSNRKMVMPTTPRTTPLLQLLRWHIGSGTEMAFLGGGLPAHRGRCVVHQKPNSGSTGGEKKLRVNTEASRAGEDFAHQ